MQRVSSLFSGFFVFCALIFATLFLLPLPIVAEASEPEMIKVGYYEDGDYMYRNAQGEYEGYNFEFLSEISKLNGLRYEIVDTGSWQNALQLLTDGKIDILPAVYCTEERAQKMLFPDQPMCNIYITLNVRGEDTQYGYEDFDAFQGMKVGIIRGGEDGESFKEYCKEHQIDVSIENYDETDDLLTALDDGTLDGVAITHLGRNSNFRSVAQFAPSPLYVAVSSKRPDILAKINQANNDILLRNPGYQMDLYDKYLAPSAEQKPVYTKEELEYIQTAEPIRVSYDPAFAPLTYRNDKGEFSGAVADMFDAIAKDSGLTFQFEANAPNTAYELMEEGVLDVVSAVDGDYLWDVRHYISSTLYYLSTPRVRITKHKSEKIKTLALIEGYRLSEWVAKNEPNQKILYFPSAQACFEAVANGEAQATYVNTYVASYLLTDSKYEDLHSNTLSQYSNKICIGVSKSADPRLFSILDKYTQSMASEQMDELLLKHSTVAVTISLTTFVRQNIGLMLILFSGIILLLCIFLRNISRSKRRIQDLLYKDSLTGLDNLEKFYLTAADLIHAPASGMYAMVYCDIDRFKLINDNFGFEEGDRLLKAYGRSLQQSIQKTECCARISADNFVLLMEYPQWEILERRLEGFKIGLDDWRSQDGVLSYEISLSFGVYRVMKEEQEDVHRMLDLANYARRSAKNNTGSPIAIYDEQMRQKALLEQELESRLAMAIEQQEFEPYYQPKVDMSSGKLVGSEALVRWNHPERGLLMPGAFIPFFEQKGIVVQVDIYLYEMVCSTIRRWMDMGLTTVPVSCNFSRLHFGQVGFVKQVTDIADKWKVPHHLLEIEITESTIASVTENIETILSALKQQGFLITIDDFGSGYSSLGQLQQLRADVLKLDRSFVSRGMREKREQIVIENLVNMGNELEMTVICEGVETELQADELQRLGCHFAQGYYYYRPMPLEKFEELMYAEHAREEDS